MPAAAKGDKKTSAGKSASQGINRPQNGNEYLDSLRDDRTVFIYGERVKDVTTHPAFRNTARMVARLYDALHDAKHADKIMVPTDTGNGGKTHAFFKAPKTLNDLLAGRSAIAEWAKITYGWLGRSPDYKAAFLATLGANAEFYDPYSDNARRWYKFSQERVPFVNHAIIHPPVDRDRPPNEVSDICCHVEKETDAGIVVSGAKVVATGSVLTNYTFVAHHGLLPVQDKKFAVVFIVPTNHPGVKFICRTSYEMTSTAMGSAFDYPLSSRFDESDSYVVFDNVFVPWERVFIYRNVELSRDQWRKTPSHLYGNHQAQTRYVTKLRFMAGLAQRMNELTGNIANPAVVGMMGELASLVSIYESMLLSHEVAGTIEDGVLWPSQTAYYAASAMQSEFNGRMLEIIREMAGSAFITLPSSDTSSSRMRP